MHKYICEICKTPFTREWENKKRPLPKYCSIECYGKGREKKHTNLIGKKFGKLKVISIADERSKSGHVCMVCLCECGKEKKIPFHHLNDQLVSCGCWKVGKERALPTFMKKIEKTDGCWNWKGMILKSGYARHCCKYAHRLSYEYHKGDIPEGKMLCHTCNNKSCVNPDHLYPGTAYDNAQDAIRDGVYERRSLTSKRYKKT